MNPDSSIPMPTPEGLAVNQVHLWCIDLEPSEFLSCHSLRPIEGSQIQDILSAEEFARAARFVKEELRTRFSAAHIALRFILGSYLNVQPSSIELTTEALGRPVLSGSHEANPLHFNLSHSHSFALVAVAHTGEIGVDVEEIRSMDSREGISRQVHSETECLRLENASDSLWFRYWTAKEAVLKALGKGFHLDPRRVELAESLEFAIAHEDDGDIRLELAACDLPHRWSGCVAAQWPINDLILHEFNWNWTADALR